MIPLYKISVSSLKYSHGDGWFNPVTVIPQFFTAEPRIVTNSGSFRLSLAVMDDDEPGFFTGKIFCSCISGLVNQRDGRFGFLGYFQETKGSV